jgi:acyl-ACP thioesterase
MTPRYYSATRPVRLSDVTPKGRARLDAVARYLQDIGNDDAVDGIGEDAAAWVVRRTTLQVDRFPVFREELTLRTWASGVGSRSAERSTSITGSDGAEILATALWVHVDLQTGRPKRLPPEFDRVYGEAAAGRTVSARLEHGDPPDGAERVPWSARFSDFDVLGHVNNAVYWAIVEEHLDLTAPVTAVLEYRGGIDRGQAAEVVVDGRGLWILADGAVAASAQIST